MSKKIVDGKELYSLQEIVKEFLHTKDQKIMTEFIDFLVLQKLIDKHIFRYEYRVSYVYTINCSFDVLMEGHYYTEAKSWQGKTLNGTLYFDEFASKVMSRLFRLSRGHKKFKLSKDLDAVLVTTAMEYIPKINRF